MLSRLKEIHIRWIGIPIVGFIAMIASPDDHMAGEPMWYQYVVALVFTAIYWNGACLIIFYFRKKYPQISKTSTRLLLTAFFIILWMSVGGLPVKLLLGISTPTDLFKWSEFSDLLPFNFIAAAVISISYEAFYFFDRYKEQFRLNEQLKNQQIRTQYEVLQNQMSPHFLFNSLNTLASIIPENTNAAVAFTEHLSEVYRYILHHKDRELVRLDAELEFVKSYMFLLHMRYPDNLTYQFNVDEQYHSLTIPPLTLQMLVENAIKHNVVSKARPLHVDIYVENGKSVIVRNNLQRKESAEKSTGTGLENIENRYRILGNRQIDIITSASNFMVAVPLIDLLEEKDLNLI